MSMTLCLEKSRLHNISKMYITIEKISVLIYLSKKIVGFYWKLVNLIGSPTVFYLLIEHNRAQFAPGRGGGGD